VSASERYRLAWQAWRRLARSQAAGAAGFTIAGFFAPAGAGAGVMFGLLGLTLAGGAVAAWLLADRADARFQAAADAEWEKIRKILEET